MEEMHMYNMKNSIIRIDDAGKILVNHELKTIIYSKNSELLATYNKYSKEHPNTLAYTDDGVQYTYGQLCNMISKICDELKDTTMDFEQVTLLYSSKPINIITMVLACNILELNYTVLSSQLSYEKIIPLIKYYKLNQIFTDANIDNPNFLKKLVENQIATVVSLNDSALKETYETFKSAYSKKGLDLNNYTFQTMHITKDELDTRTSIIIDSLSEKNQKIAVFLKNPIYYIAVKKALSQLNCEFQILNSTSPEKLIELCQIEKFDTIIYDDIVVNKADTLFWYINTFKTSIFLSESINYKSKKESEFKDLWNVIAEEDSQNVNDYGWNNSFDGTKFTIEEMQEYIDNFCTKLELYTGDRVRAFDIGCGHGLVLFQIAPKVSEYYAVDLSERIIELNQQKVKELGMNHVFLFQSSACDINTLGCKDFDIVLCSSVVQYFPNTIYLEHVLKASISILKEQGIIYIDDLMNLETKYDLIEETVQYKAKHPDAKTKMNWDNDLFVHKSFFDYFQSKYPEVISIEITNKTGKVQNELTKYRYDVLIKIDKTKSNSNRESAKYRNILFAH